MLRLLLALMLFPSLCQAQNAAARSRGPQWLVEQFFFAPAWAQKSEYYTGEMKARYASTKTMGESGAPAQRASLRSVRISPTDAIYTLQLADDRRAEDWYAYVVKEGAEWRLSAVRTLALPPLFFMLLDSLASTRSLPDSLAATLDNMRLTVSTDSALKAFFPTHRALLDSIAAGFSGETAGSIAAAPDGLNAPTASLRTLATQLAALHFRGAWRDADVPGCVLLEIGGMLDNEVGFMQCQPGAAPPSMSPERFILIESVAPDWYLYKTT